MNRADLRALQEEVLSVRMVISLPLSSTEFPPTVSLASAPIVAFRAAPVVKFVLPATVTTASLWLVTERVALISMTDQSPIHEPPGQPSGRRPHRSEQRAGNLRTASARKCERRRT